ncbi:MAG: nucleotidyltransferase family protein, partial [Bacilli bacterium]
PVSIKRINDYHSKKISNNITSATSIRNNINNINLIKNALPNDSLDLIQRISLDDYFKYLKYQILTNDNLKDILGVDEGLENKLKKEINNVYSLDGLILKLKSKRYSYNRLKRMMLHIICNVNKSDNDLKIKYVRVLAFNKLGQKVLNEVKKETNVPIITKFKKEYNDLLKLDIKATNVYSLIGKTENDFISSKKSN